MGAFFFQCLTLVLIPFLHEDIAIVTAAFFYHERGFPIAVAFFCLLAGAIASDIVVFSLGAGARRIPKLRRFVIYKNIGRARDKITRHLVLSVIFARVVPGALFPTYIACGWLGVPFVKFFIVAFCGAVVYTAIMFTLVLIFGTAIALWAGAWGWTILLLIVGFIATAAVFRPAIRIFMNIITGHGRVSYPGAATHSGMPALGSLERAVGPAERIPPLIFYIPLGLHWFWLGMRYRCLTLPTLANPNIEAGGLWGESKSKCLQQIAPGNARFIAPYIVIKNEDDSAAVTEKILAMMTQAGLDFPAVAKPDIGWQGYGVQVIKSRDELAEYVELFPTHAKIVVQRLVPYEGEAGIFYVRQPNEPRGRIASMTFRYFPHVTGDGTSSVRELLSKDPRSSFKANFHTGDEPYHLGVAESVLDSVPGAGEVVRLSFIGSIRVGGLYRNASAHITPALTARIDEIARSMPQFCYGRFDVRFRSVEELERGEEFQIIEVNGAGSEAIHVWDPQTPVREVYRELFGYQNVLFEIGAQNRDTGLSAISVRQLIRFARKQNRLVANYPASM